ncbi:filamin-hypothetical protein [Limosa lapponica baueri]|uniref:Uncharacterized protein n=1 Tax=Limosa lapponica baueri TaxID=1758121 RepID=A0A2I0T119_LIMLA|nr:filamin-hypothetical protein [Limosa lapponica baueri]
MAMRRWPWGGGNEDMAMCWWPWVGGHVAMAMGGASAVCPPRVTGVCSEFLVKTANAGAGALAVTIDGPSKVKLDCVECPEGHRVTYTPMAPGNYLISIKYGGPHHIVGSPFKAKVTGCDIMEDPQCDMLGGPQGGGIEGPGGDMMENPQGDTL